MWTCPLCNAQLSQVDRVWRCVNNHSFDQAKEGYVNLLPVQNKRSKDPGDNTEMVVMRRQFLSLGHYLPFVDAINQGLPDEGTGLDIGCGEGYYTAQLKGCWQGFDISKDAVKRAAKRYRNCQFAVASSANIPVADAQFDNAVAVFSPVTASEIVRVVKPGGRFIIAGPGPKHLETLKQAIYPNAQPSSLIGVDHPLLDLQHECTIDSSFTLSSANDIHALIAMTPMHFHGDPQAKQALIDGAMLKTTAQFHVRQYLRLSDDT